MNPAGLGIRMSLPLVGLPAPSPTDSSRPSISSLTVSRPRAASTGLRRYCTMIAVPSLTRAVGASAASVTNVLRHSGLSVSQTWSKPVPAAVSAIWRSSGRVRSM